MKTIGVCGFGRCGSTMVMAMLHAGGLEPVVGSMAGSYELPGLDGLPTLAPALLAGRSVKLLDGVEYFALPAADWRFIWIDRDPHEQAKSLVKFAAALGLCVPGAGSEKLFAESMERDRPRLLAAYRALGPVLEMLYEDILADPFGAADTIAGFLPGLDIPAAAEAVHRRTGECRPDLAFELQMAAS